MYCVLFLLLSALSAREVYPANVAPDVTGLVGTPYYYNDKEAAGNNAVRIPLKFWANPRDSALRPRRHDRIPHVLMKLMGEDFDPIWMRRTRREDKMLNVSSRILTVEEERRPSAYALWEAAHALQPPSTWPSPPPGTGPFSEPSNIVPAAWLVALGTCPARTEWRDLGQFFWPRIVKRVECEKGAKRKPGGGTSGVSCGWPPGRLACAPGAAKTLHLLRWHCRLRDGAEETWARLAQLMTPGKPVPSQPRRKRRERYRCEWLKVPYPVPADCQCGGP